VKRETDTSIYVGHMCEICHKPVTVSKGDGYWRNRGGVVRAWHTTCIFPIRKSA